MTKLFDIIFILTFITFLSVFMLLLFDINIAFIYAIEHIMHQNFLSFLYIYLIKNDYKILKHLVLYNNILSLRKYLLISYLYRPIILIYISGLIINNGILRFIYFISFYWITCVLVHKSEKLISFKILVFLILSLLLISHGQLF